MKILGVIFIVLSVLFAGILLWCGVNANYQYEKDVYSFWSLADKSSSLTEKSKYVDEYIGALEKSNHAEYSAVWLKTPDNSFSKNLDALKSLGKRLQEIQTMDVQSFAYQTAIQQITAQEQGEAKSMNSVLNNCWCLANYPILWGWIFGLIFFTLSALITSGFYFLMVD